MGTDDRYRYRVCNPDIERASGLRLGRTRGGKSAWMIALVLAGLASGCGRGATEAPQPIALGGPETPQTSPTVVVASPGSDVAIARIETYETQGGWEEFTRALGGGERASVSISAEGGNAVEFAFVGPDGTMYDETSNGITTTGQPDDLEARIEQPADGQWTFRVRLAHELPEPVRLFASVHQSARPNVAPDASISAEIDGRTVTVSADGSFDPDGGIATILWSFDDEGPFAEGPPDSHWRMRYTYPEAGTYWIQLGLVDDDDAVGPAAIEVTVE